MEGLVFCGIVVRFSFVICWTVPQYPVEIHVLWTVFPLSSRWCLWCDCDLESCKINYFCKLFQRTNINKESIESNDRLCIISVAFSLSALDHCYRKYIYFFLLIKAWKWPVFLTCVSFQVKKWQCPPHWKQCCGNGEGGWEKPSRSLTWEHWLLCCCGWTDGPSVVFPADANWEIILVTLSRYCFSKVVLRLAVPLVPVGVTIFVQRQPEPYEMNFP